jgi:phosphoribosylformylglycinamidine synthase
MRNACLQYRCQSVFLRVENADTPFTRAMRAGDVIAMPISHGEGQYHADPDTLRALNGEGRVVFRYVSAHGRLEAQANPNGSVDHIAGITNEGGTVLGLMPHPERAAEAALGGTDGLRMFHALLGSLVEAGTFSPR